MDPTTSNKIVSFIWGIADDVLRDLFKRGKYPDVILPMCVIRRMDAVLEPTKQDVLDTKKMLDDAGIAAQNAVLCTTAGQAFYNTSKFTLRDLKSRGSHQQLLADFAAGHITEEALPRDVLTVLLRNEERVEMAPELMMREIAFYLQAGSHSTANATAHAFHDVMTWCISHPEDQRRIDADPLFLQRCVHESLRLHPASPVAWRRSTCPMALPNGSEADTNDRVVVDLATANRDPTIFGHDADVFNPHRTVREGTPPWGLTFGVGVHTCLGRDLDGGLQPRADTDPDTHQYGIVPLLVQELVKRKARPDPTDKALAASHTERANWGYYPILLDPVR